MHLPPIAMRKETICSERAGEVFTLPSFPLDTSKAEQKRELMVILLPELSGSMRYLSGSSDHEVGVSNAVISEL